MKSVSPSEDIYSLSTVEITFNKEVVAAEGVAVVVKNAAGEVVANTTYTVEG